MSFVFFTVPSCGSCVSLLQIEISQRRDEICLTYGYEYKSLGISFILCSFNRVILVVLLLG